MAKSRLLTNKYKVNSNSSVLKTGCRNTTLWTGRMVNCLSSFHPPNEEVERDNIVSFILNSTDTELKDICDDVKYEYFHLLFRILGINGVVFGIYVV